MGMLNHKLKKLNLPTRDVPPSELISNEMERMALIKEARAKGVYYDMLESARIYDSEGEKENDSDDTEDEAVDNVEEDNEEEEEQEEDNEEEEEEEEEEIEQPEERGQLEPQQVKPKIRRGPTDMKKFWHRHGPHNIVILEFNHLGQPCGVNTSQLTNFIAYLVKGKDVSMGHEHWRKVPTAEKEKLWTTVKALINERFQQNPALFGEQHTDGDLYSELFTPPRNSRRHGFGLLVGGKASKVLDEAVEALRDSKEENIELRGYVETLMARSQQLEEKVNYLLARQRDGHTDEMHGNQEREEAAVEELAASTLAELSMHKQAPPEQEQTKEASSAPGRTISASASIASGITSAPSSSHNTLKVPTATTLKSTSAPFKSPFKAPGKAAVCAEKTAPATVQGSAEACAQKTAPLKGSKATTAATKVPKAAGSAKGSTTPINGSEAASAPTIPEAAGAANGSTIALKGSAAAAAPKVPEATGASKGSTTLNGSKAAPKGSAAAAHKLPEAAGSANGSTTALNGSEAAASAPRISA
ncbi:hypothetical protein ACQ4PT_059309 [Festuca glaucescens]